MKLISDRIHRATKLEFMRATAGGDLEALPEGVCGRLTGIALVYNQPDDYGTMFTPGCLAKTRAEKVATGKVKLFADHGPFTDTHVGTVRDLVDVGDAAVMTADLFDTEAGRKMKEYLEAVIASDGETGLSIGFRPRDKEWREVDMPSGKDTLLVYKEIELREISVTPVPAVPGTEVTGVRRESGESDQDLLRRTLRHILQALPEHDARAVIDEVYASSAAAADTTSTPSTAATAASAGIADAASAESATGTEPKSESVTDDQRMAAVRASFA